MTEYLCGFSLSQKCDYVFSRGEPFIINQKPAVLQSGDYNIFCRSDIDGLKDGDLVYCKIDNLPLLHDLLLRYNKKIYLITHDSDYEITESVFKSFSSNILHWWGPHISYPHPRLTSIPLGLGNPYVPASIKPSDIPGQLPSNRNGLLYINHRIETNEEERRRPYLLFKDSSWVTLREPSPVGEKSLYIKELLGHKFVLCPRGNGIDTYRLWECLLMGAIPIVRDCINIRFFKDFPILIIDDYENITRDLLLKSYNILKPQMAFVKNKLTTDYWINLINEKRHKNKH